MTEQETLDAHVVEAIVCPESPDPKYRIFAFKTDGDGSPPWVSVAVPLELLADVVAAALLGPLRSAPLIPE